MVETVLEVLQLNHTSAWTPSSTILGTYLGPPPEMVQMDLSLDTVTNLALKLSVGEGTGGSECVSLHKWLFLFCEASADLWVIYASFAWWMANHCTS